MTQEEYAKKFKEDNQNNDENDEKNNRKNKIKKLFQSLGPKKLKYIDININERNLSPYNSSCSYNFSNIKTKNKSPKLDNINKKRNNLYHYKINYSTQRNNVSHNLIKNTKMSNYGNYKSGLQNNLIELNANSLKGFGKHYFKNENSSNKKALNKKFTKIKKNNNYINIENSSIKEPNKQNYTYNNNINLNGNINSQKYLYGERSSDNVQNSEFIGIIKKYEKKIDELEKNILKNHNNLKNKNIKSEQNNNNFDNFFNKLKVNIINMEDYALKKKNKNKNFQKNDLKAEKYGKIEEVENGLEINVEPKEQNLNDGFDNNNYNNENDFLSQKSNMAGKRQLIIKK